MNTLDKVKYVLAQTLCVDEQDIALDSHLENDLGADSFDSIELVLDLEDGFSIEIPDKDAEKFRTVRDIVEYIDKKKGEA